MTAWLSLQLARSAHGLVLLANDRLLALLAAPLFWGVVCAASVLCLTVPRSWVAGGWWRTRVLVPGLSTASIVCLGLALPPLGELADQLVFWILAATTVISAAAAICMRSAVYAAIWFAMSLLGTAGLFLLQGAQFLAVATVVVYAGAIVVTFLFVVMLAQPQGHDTYDRISWGWLAKPLSVLAATAMVIALSLALDGVRRGAVVSRSAVVPNEVLTSTHMARLGAELFSRHLLSVEVAGTLLMVALVGAVAIAAYGKDRMLPSEEPGDE